MIRTEREYQEAIKRLKDDTDFMEQQRQKLVELKLSDAEIERAMEPAICFHEQLKEEAQAYEKLRRGEFEPLYNLNQLGGILIGARIYLDIPQKELAERLGVSESSISRDEKNEYHGISTERAQRILEALGVVIKISVEVKEVA